MDEDAAAPAAIAVENLIFDYPTLRALHGLSFAVEPRSVTALVGAPTARARPLSCAAWPRSRRPLPGVS